MGEAAAKAAEDAAAQEAAEAKKKKRRSKNKNKEEVDAEEEPAKDVVPEPQGPTGAELADKKADQDEELIDYRKRLAALEKEGEKAGKEDIQELISDVNKALESRKAAVGKQSREKSEKIAQNVK